MKGILRHIIFVKATMFLAFLFIFNGGVSARGNDTVCRSNIQVDLRTSYAFLICHHHEMNVFRAHFPVFEMSVQQSTYGDRTWHQLLNYPAVGVAFMYCGVGLSPEIGNIFALYPYMSFNFLKSKKNMLNARLGVGMGYATKCYDRETNPKNNFLGSHFNAAFSINLEYSRVLSERWQLSFYSGLKHLSNGGIRCPNNGINIFEGGASARFFINKPKSILEKEIIDNEQFKGWEREKISYYFGFLYSLKDIDKFIGYNKNWSVFNIRVDVMKRVSQLSKVGIGFDLVYDNTDKEVLKDWGVTYKPAEILKPGINVAYELVLQTTSFLFNFGCHIAGKEMSGGRIYQKINIKQNITKNIFLTFGLTTHWGWADYIGFGIGYSIN